MAGELAATSAFDTFTRTRDGRGPRKDVARLHRARLVAVPSKGGNGPDDLAFTTANGARIRQGLFLRRHFEVAVRVRKASRNHPAKKAALPARLHGLRFHDPRHTCVALLIAQGAHAKAIQQHMGHSSTTITMDRYGHVFPAEHESIADRLDAAFAESMALPENVAHLQQRS